jgi:two-component sensor histidine kinase
MNVDRVRELSPPGAENWALRLPESALNSAHESAALNELAMQIAADPAQALRTCVTAAQQWCEAASAGLSVLRLDGAGRAILHWATVAGLLAAQEGATAPRDASACGLCLDAGTTILVSRPERMFTHLHGVQPAIVEKLIVPLYGSGRQPIGTLWVVQHDPVCRFGGKDSRIMEQIALLLAPVLQHLVTTAEHQATALLLDSYRDAQQEITRALLDERARRERAEAAEHETRRISDVGIQDAHHRTKNTLQMASNLLRLHSHASHSLEVRTALEEGYLRLNLLARAHELLYKSPDDAGDILMPKLLGTVADTLRISFPQIAPRVALEVNVDPILLRVDQAISLGLLANEVLTNAYKHAFPSGVTGKISVCLRRTAEQAMILQITDDGIGMHAIHEEGGLGLTLIRAFATHLHGTLTIGTPLAGRGTQITVAMSAPDPLHSKPPATDSSS